MRTFCRYTRDRRSSRSRTTSPTSATTPRWTAPRTTSPSGAFAPPADHLRWDPPRCPASSGLSGVIGDVLPRPARSMGQLETQMSERRMVVVHAHPDDETLWTGGMIARYVASGVDVTLVTCTLGEQGEVLSEELRGLAADRADQLGGYRLAELRAACAVLGVADQRFLGGIGQWRDSGMVAEPGARASVPAQLHARAFAAGALDEQVDALVEVLDAVRPQVVVTYGPDGGYGHPDHVRAHQVTMAAAAQTPEVARVFWAVHPTSAVARGIT